MRAFISDIHANLEALCAVMDDIEKHDVREIFCLGDIVGYGPDPQPCIDIVMEKAEIILRGNHDHALVHRPLTFNPIAAEMMHIGQPGADGRGGAVGRAPEGADPHFFPCGHNGKFLQCLLLENSQNARWEFVENLPDTYQESNLLCVHGSPLDPVFEYLFPDRFRTGWRPARITEQFGAIDGVALCGHTHIPCVITEELLCVYPSKTDKENRFELDPVRKYIINVGSVGQPRDGDNRACYLLMDENAMSFEWRRISYDIHATMQKAFKMCGDNNWCGARLLLGK